MRSACTKFEVKQVACTTTRLTLSCRRAFFRLGAHLIKFFTTPKQEERLDSMRVSVRVQQQAKGRSERRGGRWRGKIDPRGKTIELADATMTGTDILEMEFKKMSKG